MGKKMRRKAGLMLLMAVIVIAGCLYETGCAGKKQPEENAGQSSTGIPETPVESAEWTVSDSEYDKEETVQVEADASGKVKKITVETKLKHGSGNTIEDFSKLKNIKNTEGDEEYTVSADGKLIWENHGEDIRYEGESQDSLPVELAITYELDGKVIAPKELAGKSGKLKMRFDYTNKEARTLLIGEKEVETCIPFMAISMVILPEEVFSDVKVENGKLMDVGDDRIAIGYAFPGLADALKLYEMEDFEDTEIPDYVEITANVTDFKLDFTATVISTGAFEDFEEEDIDDIDELVDDMKELRDASKELVDATGELSDGVDEFGDYLQEYVDAMESVKQGTAGIQQGAGTLKKNSRALAEGAKNLQGGLEQLRQSVSGTVSGGDAGPGGGSAAQIAQVLEDMNERLEKLEESTAGGDEETKAQIAGLKADISALSAALFAAQGEGGESMGDLVTALDQLVQGSAQLAEGAEAFDKGMGEFYKGSEKLNNGVKELRDAGKELMDGYDELIDGVGEFRDGVKEFDEEGIQELADFAGEDLQNLADRMRALIRADEDYTNFGGILPEKKGAVRFVIETEEIGG